MSDLGNEQVYPRELTERLGLTKRELFAAMAMQGLQAKPVMYVASDLDKEASFYLLRKETAKRAVQIADALIAELEKTRD